MSKFTVGMKLKTRNGRDARILAIDLKGDMPIAAALSFSDGEGEALRRFYVNGQMNINCLDGCDLILPKEELWINKSQYGIYIYNTKQRALAARDQCGPAIIYEYVAKRFVEAD